MSLQLRGTSARSNAWAANTFYKAGQIVTFRGAPFAANADFTSGATFTFSNWTSLMTGNALPPHTHDPRYAGGLAAGNQAANRTNYTRVHGSPMLISKLGINVGTQSGNICLAVYSSTGSGSAARPGTRLATTGTVACPAVGEASIALDVPVVVVPGDWFSFSADNTTAQIFKSLPPGMNLALSGYNQQTSAFPAPATAGSLGTSSSVFYIVGVE